MLALHQESSDSSTLSCSASKGQPVAPISIIQISRTKIINIKMKNNFTFRRRLLALALLFVSVGAWAGISWDATTKTLTLESPFDMNDFNNNYSTQASQTEVLVIKGAAPDWAQIRGKFQETVNGKTVYHLKEIDMTNMTINADGTFSNWPGKDNAYGQITSLKLPEGLKEISTAAFAELRNMESVTIPSSVETIGERAFSDCVKLSNIIFEEVPHVATFKSGCFQRTAFTSFTFPTSIKLIEANAFNECYGMTIMTFPEGIKDLEIIGGNAEGGAFSNCTNITDIYIETTNYINCNINGYPWAITYAQGDPSRPTATLHFPEGQAEYYTNLSHPLTIDIASDPGSFHNWLMDHVEKASQAIPKNGWWQFINSGSDTGGPDPIPGGRFLRTFSDPNYARIVPRGVKAYAVTDVKKNAEKSTTENPYYEVSFMILDVIPKNTGVILFGEPNATSKDGTGKTLTMTIISLADVHGCIDGTKCTKTGETVDLSLRRKNWENLAEEHIHFKNYLEPSTVGDEESTDLQPYKVENGTAYRYFGFSHYRKSKTGKSDQETHGKATINDYDYAGFFRCKQSKIGKGKAYLKLSAAEYPEPEGGEIIIPSTCQNIKYNVYKDDGSVDKVLTFNYRDEYKAKSGWQSWSEDSPFWHHAIWELPDMFGERDNAQVAFAASFPGEVLFDEFEDGTATMIIPGSMIDIEEAGDFYTLQGVKVANPSKGIYIKNGKKVVVK